MNKKDGTSFILFLSAAAFIGVIAFAEWATRPTPQPVAVKTYKAVKDPDSWWVANQDLSECFESEDPYTVSKKMRADGRDSKVMKSWQYEGRYDISWTWNGGLMERYIYPSKRACEYDQQISRR